MIAYTKGGSELLPSSSLCYFLKKVNKPPQHIPTTIPPTHIYTYITSPKSPDKRRVATSTSRDASETNSNQPAFPSSPSHDRCSCDEPRLCQLQSHPTSSLSKCVQPDEREGGGRRHMEKENRGKKEKEGGGSEGQRGDK
jgi:hypothetical protein